jgi:hypothetical protein
MRAWWIVGIALSAGWVAGCSDATKPVPVSGTVKTASGKAVTGVRLILEPVGGSVLSTFGFDLDEQGQFKGVAPAGTYTFYLARAEVERDDNGQPANAAEAKKLRSSDQLLRSFPAAYHAAKGARPDRKVEVTSGATLTLVVSP